MVDFNLHVRNCRPLAQLGIVVDVGYLREELGDSDRERESEYNLIVPCAVEWMEKVTVDSEKSIQKVLKIVILRKKPRLLRSKRDSNLISH